MFSEFGRCVQTVGLGMALACAVAAQTPRIDPPLQSRAPNESLLGNEITSGTPIQSFLLVIRGQFDSEAFTKVRWTNTSTGQTTEIPCDFSLPCDLTSNRIEIPIPSQLFSQPVAARESIEVRVVQSLVSDAAVPAVTRDVRFNGQEDVSNATNFFLNPPMINRPMPFAAVGTPYAQPLISGGTPPFQVSVNASVLPPGLTVPPSQSTLCGTTQTQGQYLCGTPTAQGEYVFPYQIVDAWQNSFQASASVRVFRPPVLSSLDPSSRLAGLGNFQLTVTGNDFLSGEFASQVVFGGTALSTTYVNSNTLQAAVPGSLVVNAATIPVFVRNPGNADSNVLNFVVTASAPLTIATSVLPAATTGQPYTAQLAGTGGIGAYTWSATGLPAGFSINSSTGVISGSTTSTAAATVTVTLRDSLQQTATKQFTVTVNAPALTIVTTALPAATAGQAYTAQLAGTGGVGAYAWSATGLPAGLSLNSSTGVISGSTTSTAAATVMVTLRDTIQQTATKQFTLTINVPALTIVTTSLPNATAGRAYSVQLFGSGGVAPYTWSSTGLPAGVSMNPTGLISGSTNATGAAGVSITLRDSANQSVTATLVLTINDPPLTMSGTLPGGQVGALYSGSVSASGGRPGYTFSLTSGNLPGGLLLSPAGGVSGTPTNAGVFRFSIQVADSTGATASGEFTVEIQPPPLAVTGTVSDVPMGSPMSFTFGATGGVPPYTFRAGGSLPSGTSFSGATLSGTPVAMGIFTFTIEVTDSSSKTASRNFTIRVKAPALQLTGSAGNGKVGVAYSATFGATGGVPPYTFTASGLPPGLALQGNSIGGTPTARGTFQVAVNVTDTDGGRAGGTVTVVIEPATLSITGSLPNGTVAVPYSASLGVAGGVPPYTWAMTGAPDGVTASGSGSLSGTPTRAAAFTVNATVTDSTGATVSGTFPVVISPVPVEITTASLPAGTAGTPYSGTLGAAGGVPPYSWSASGLPSGIAVSATGVFSGAPEAPGTANLIVTVRDSMGATASRVFTLAAGLPSAPVITATGLPANSNPGTQQQFQIGLGSPYPGPVSVLLTLAFAADTGPDDPAVQFISGGRSLTATIPAGGLSTPNIGLQVGTVSGVAAITARFTAFGTDITPTPIPTLTIRVNATPPVISSVAAVRNANGFTVTVSGFCSSRAITQAVFTFTAAAGTDLQTTQLTVPVEALFGQWFGSADSAPFGSQFTLILPFTVQGSAQSIVSLTVRLVSRDGSSAPVSVNLQ